MSNDNLMSQPNIKHNFNDGREEIRLIPQQTLRRGSISNPQQAKDVLERWVEAHSDNPYPKYKDRVEL